MGHADRIAVYTEPPAVALLKRAALLAQKVAMVERTARTSLLGPAGQAVEIPFTVRITVFRGPGDPVPGTLGALTDTYLGLPSRRMVITGVAGAGKTVLALELVLLLLDRRRPEDPVPVRIPLAEWDPETPLESWLAGQIADTYSLRASTARDLVAQRLVLPVLDGLDEMDGEEGSAERAARALHQINRYHGLRGPAPLVVTCRSQTYERLSRERGGLEAAAVAAIEELDSRQIRTYLENTLAARPAVERRAWSEVIDNLDRLPAGALSTPWRLYLATTIYSGGGRDPRDLLTFTAPAELDRVLLERLIPVAAEASPHRRYTAERTVKWLTSFATHSPHFSVAGRDAAPAADILLHRLAPVVGLKRVIGIHYVAAILLGGLPFWMPMFLRGGEITGSDLALTSGTCLYWGALWGVWALRRTVEPVRFVRPRLTLKLVWQLMRVDLAQHWWEDVHRGGHTAGRLVKTAGVCFAVVVPLGILADRFWLHGTWGIVVIGAAAGLVFFLVVPVLGWFVYTLFAPLILLVEHSFQAADTLPVQRPADPLRQDLLVSAIVLVAVTPWAVLWTHAVLLVASAMPWIVNRAWMRYAVSAAVGWARGMLPLRPARFLAWAHRAGLLRTTGRTYQFRHRALQQWLRDEAQRRVDLERLARSAGKRALDDDRRFAAAQQLAGLDPAAGVVALARLTGDDKVGLRVRMRALEARTVLHAERDERDKALALVRLFAEVPLKQADTYECRWATDALTRLDPPVGRDLLTRLVHGAKAGKGSHDIRLWAATTLARLDPPAGAAALTHLAGALDLGDGHRVRAAEALTELGHGVRDEGH